MRTVEATKSSPRAKRIAGILGVPSRCSFGEGLCRRRYLELIDVELPWGAEAGKSGKSGEQKLGTAEPLLRCRRPISTSLPGTDRCRTPRGRRGWHVRKEWPAKARNRSRVA